MSVATLIIYCLLIVAVSVAGGLLPMWLRLTHRRMQLALSFVSGVMLGVAMLHLLPHAWLEWREARGDHASLQPVILWLLGGFLGLFLLERFFTFHQHEVEVSVEGGLRVAESAPPVESEHASHAAARAAGHDCGLDSHGHTEHSRGRSMSWSGAFLGLAVHSLLNGVALAASVTAATHEAGSAWLGFAGIATFLVIFLHKPFDALTIGTLMAASRRPLRLRHAVNAMFALMVPVGAALFGLGLQLSHESTHEFIAAVLALSAGMFMCIALSDLLPELHFHAHDRVKLTALLLAGLLVAYVISVAEGELHHHGEVDIRGEPDDSQLRHID